MTPLSRRVAAMAEAGTVVNVHRPSAPRSGDLINLSSGDPALATPTEVVQAAMRRLEAGNLTYTDVHGMPELKEAIRAKFLRENGLSYGDDQIAVSAGSKQVMVNALLATLDPGDEVIIPAPYFAPYPRMVALAGGVPKIVPTSPSSGFKLTENLLVDMASERTRWVILNSPNNPSGAIYDAEELRTLANALLKANPDVLFMSDEVYEHYCYDGNSVSSLAAVSEEVFERTLTANSVSKTFSMTGWRIGYGGGPADLIAAMRTIQHATTTSPPQVSQVGATTALGLSDAVLQDRGATASALLDAATKSIDEIAGIRYLRPAGSIYMYLNCEGLLGSTTPDGGRIDSDSDLSIYLQNEFGVQLLPGAYYGMSPYLRLTFVIDEQQLEHGIARFKAGVEALEVPSGR